MVWKNYLIVGGFATICGVVALVWFIRGSVPSSLPREVGFSEMLPPSGNQEAPAVTIPGLMSTAITSQPVEIQEELSRNTSYTTYRASFISDGLTVYGLLTVPQGEEPQDGFPAVVFLHGYIPPDQYRTTEKYEDYVNYLARNGMVVFKIDYRGHGDSDGDPTGAYFSNGYVIDALSAVKALQQSDVVNPEKIGLWAHSMSGNVALRSAVVDPDIKAVVIWAGAVYSYEDFVRYGLNDQSFDRRRLSSSRIVSRSQSLFEKYGSVSAQTPFWSQMAPTNYLNAETPPIQLHHAENDSVVNIGYSEDLVVELDEAGVEHSFYRYESGGHNLTSPAFGPAMQRTVEFYREQLNF